MNPVPLEIRRSGNSALHISWSDGVTAQISARTLRVNCPCAECRAKRGDDSHATPLTPKKRSLAVIDATLDEQTDLQEIWGIGQYALGMRWGDGHQTGIFTFSLLRDLSGSGTAS